MNAVASFRFIFFLFPQKVVSSESEAPSISIVLIHLRLVVGLGSCTSHLFVDVKKKAMSSRKFVTSKFF